MTHPLHISCPGIIVGKIWHRIGVRWTGIMGALLLAVGCLAGSFATRPTHIAITMGLFSGEIAPPPFFHIFMPLFVIMISYRVYWSDEVMAFCYGIVMVPNKRSLQPGFGQWVGTGYKVLYLLATVVITVPQAARNFHADKWL